ncbi:NUDIX domain-containing protein (plasmid) [Amycolatopsis sp. FU40]|uniref:NUDIX domain-containing protein n=1 Tax=Amycolatopsis sp. FU40 TaxID=2914159 RepID=UPI001F29F02B|nr:NUDIX domain-containing protein [Amycolatopsis sp. FU40]UKD50830.1 NUDIX domain-containing protein [Amycolatopsis sp. FU40]
MLTYRTGDAADWGGLDYVISLTQDQADALGTDAGTVMEFVDTMLTSLAAWRTGADPVVPEGGRPSLKARPVSTGSAWTLWALRDLSALSARAEGALAAAIRDQAAAELSHGDLAMAMGVARSTAQDRRKAVLGAEPGAAEMWARGERAPVDAPGAKVPDTMRSWSVPWPGYLPVDITPDELLGEGLAASVAEGWAEPYPTPYEIDDWFERSEAALVPFEFDDRRWPLNPAGRTGRTGRNLGKWGENAAADPIVVAGRGSERQVLLIRRRDVGAWAIPGGMVDPGETAPATLVRELREETRIDLTAVTPTVLGRDLVDDWRNTDHAWVASTSALFLLEETRPATAGDDAADVRWMRFRDVEQLAADLEGDGGLYAPHKPLLQRALNRIEGEPGDRA